MKRKGCMNQALSFNDNKSKENKSQKSFDTLPQKRYQK